MKKIDILLFIIIITILPLYSLAIIDILYKIINAIYTYLSPFLILIFPVGAFQLLRQNNYYYNSIFIRISGTSCLLLDPIQFKTIVTFLSHQSTPIYVLNCYHSALFCASLTTARFCCNQLNQLCTSLCSIYCLSG